MKVLAVAGQSGGHIFPALGFLAALKEEHPDTKALLLLPKTAMTQDLKIEGVQIKYISISNIRLRPDLKSFLSVINFIIGTAESLAVLLEFRPDVVVGFGSIVSVPAVIFAWLFRMKTLIHEQNVVPGRANRLLVKFSDKIAVSFKETAKYLSCADSKVAVTGNPLRKELKRLDRKIAADFFGFDCGKTTILVMGGSSGSHNINMVFFEAASRLKEGRDIQVIHLSGARDYGLLKEKYDNSGINVRLFSFFDKMEYAYSAADFTICRAGALSITEIMYFALPAIMIPYPFAAAHQAANAKLLEEKGGAVVIEDNILSKDLLLKEMTGLIDAPERMKKMSSSSGGMNIERAGKLLVNEIMAA